MKNLSVAQKAYLAGFLDGDGSIYIRLKPNKTYKYRYQIAPYIVFFQSNKERLGLAKLQQMTNVGYLRERKDKIIEYTIGDMPSIEELLQAIQPYLRLKKRQSIIMLEVIRLKKRIKNGHDFLKICKKIDRFQELNYSKKRLNNAVMVEKRLLKEKLLTP